MRPLRSRVVVCSAVFLVAVAARAHDPAAALPGFSDSAAAAQLETEELILPLLDTASTAQHFRFLTDEPHEAGSARNFELAEYTRDRFVEYGLEDVAMHEYKVLLPFPELVHVEMVEPERFEASLREDDYSVDKGPQSSGVGTTYLGMSSSGDVTAELIYANSGNPEDYDWLESQGIDPRGKIALVRYSVPYSYRGFKAWEAERRGVKALIIYSDPAEDGYGKGEVYPEGPWGPESHIQRGAITYDFIVPGDPLTPGWASVEGARRIDRREARAVPGIVAVPMSWRDAKPLLENLGGPVAPDAWQGGLPLTYHVGAGPAKMRVNVQMDDAVRSIWVVTGRIRGTEEPEKSVVLGNHRDAWVYGGVDPSSGSATLLETARTLGELARRGHRPKRSLVLASWDAEEVHLTGSTEWGEQFADDLRQNAIAYVNVDSSTSGEAFSVSAVASLNPVVVSVARDVIDPNSRLSVLEISKRRLADGGAAADVDLVDNDLGSGSDYTVFLNFLGVPIVDMTFEGPYGVYHSKYDGLYWMEHFGDPGYRYMTAMVEVWARMALRLANAEIYPYDFGLYANRVAGFLDQLAALPGVADNLDLSPAADAVGAWTRAAARLQGAVREALAVEGPGKRFRSLNQALLDVERQLLSADGIPGRPWFKHVLYAPRYTYAAMSLPGVTEAIEAGDWVLARRQLEVLAGHLSRVAVALEEAAGEVPTG